MKPLSKAATLAAWAVISGWGCVRSAPIVDVDGRRPQKLEGTAHLSWTIDRDLSFDRLSCSEVNARYVLFITEDARLIRTFRMRCDLPVREAWIPVERGEYTVHGELVDEAGRWLSKTVEAKVGVRAATDQVNLPLLFGVKR